MEEKAVCFYCATVYPADQAKCPLCGSTKRSEDYVIPQRRERTSQGDRKSKSKGGKYAAGKKPGKKTRPSKVKPKPLLIAALVLLSLAVAVMFWFIGDMIGWFPGLEDRVDRETESQSSVNTDCKELLAEPTRLTFSGVGQSLELCISVNASCEEKLYCTSNDPGVATISGEAQRREDTEYKSATFAVTAVAEGSTVITVSCGEQTMGIPLSVAAGEGGTFLPELNWKDVEFTTAEESVALEVTNLPEGATAVWTSGDQEVATVDASGLVKPVATGETVITCTVNGAAVQVKVRCDLEKESGGDDGAHLETTDASVDVGESFPLFLYDGDGEHIEEISYVVDDAAVCEVVDNYVKALKEGTTNVRVIYGEREFVCIVRVG